MAKCKWFKFYPSDFLTGIRGLNSADVTTYIIVLCELYDHEGECTRDDARMADRCQMRQARFTEALNRLIAMGKITSYLGRLSNKRAAEEIGNRLQVAMAKAEARKPKRDLNGTLTRPKLSENLNAFNGNSRNVQPYKEIREDKKESFLEVGTLRSEEALEEARRRSAAAVEAALKRRDSRNRKGVH